LNKFSDKEISAFKQVKKFYSKIDSIYQPFLELDVDEKEFCIFKTLLLFQFEENLSDEGIREVVPTRSILRLFRSHL
jgi:hypothetical protein